MRPSPEVADVFRHHGPAYRAKRADQLSLAELKVMAAVENCRTAVLGGHIDCGLLASATKGF